MRPARLGKTALDRGSKCTLGPRRLAGQVRGSRARSRRCNWRGKGGVGSQVGPCRPLCGTSAFNSESAGSHWRGLGPGMM